jgi:hypothetical protein
MSITFAFNDGPALPLRFRIANATPVVIVDASGAATGGAIRIARFEVNENTGSGTPSLTVDIFNTLDSSVTYLGSNGVVYNAKALTAGQSVVFDGGYVIQNGEELRVTSSDAAGKLDVIGIKIGRTGRSP